MRARYKVRVPFVLKNNGQEIHGATRNISLLGISAYSDSPVPQVQPVQCVMSLPDSQKPLVVNGTIIRCEPLAQPHPDGSHEVGVFFKQFEGTGEGDLLRFLDRVLEQEQGAVRAGYRALKQRIADRKKRKRMETLEKRRRKLRRLRRRRAKLLAKAKAKAKKKRARKRSPRSKKR